MSQRRSDRSEGEVGRKAAAEEAERAAVQLAEQLVGAAWIAGLLDAEAEAGSHLRACETARDEAAAALDEVLDPSERDGDVGAARDRLADATASFLQCTAEFAAVSELVADELEGWAIATWVRPLPAAVDEKDEGGT